jgi:hypothetical protein
MGMVAPVGSLVATQPLGAHQSLHAGEIIVFRPRPQFPDPDVHRIYRILPGPRYMTKGDLNPGPDPWTISRVQILGTPVVIIPAMGWIYKLSTWLCAGAAVLVVGSRLTRGRVRPWIVILGPVVLIAVPIVRYRILVNSYVYRTSQVGRILSVRLVNTGILPARFAVSDGPAAYSAPGQEVNVRGAFLAHHSRISSTVEVALPWWGWALVGLILLSPLVLRKFAATSRGAPTMETDADAHHVAIESCEDKPSGTSRTSSSLALSTEFEPSWTDESALVTVAGEVEEKQLSRLENNAY